MIYFEIIGAILCLLVLFALSGGKNYIKLYSDLNTQILDLNDLKNPEIKPRRSKSFHTQLGYYDDNIDNRVDLPQPGPPNRLITNGVLLLLLLLFVKFVAIEVFLLFCIFSFYSLSCHFRFKSSFY